LIPVDARKKTLQVLARHIQASERAQLEAQLKDLGSEGDVRVAGEVPKPPKLGAIDNEVGGHLKRAIPKDYDYDPRALKPLAEMLWALSVSLGHAMTAHRKFVKLKSATVSPDGMMGGRGYVMSVKDIRKTLHEACEAISAVSDTIHDELHAPHWQPKLADLEKNDVEDVERLVGEAEKILDDPEGETEDSMDEGIDEAEKKGPRAELGDAETRSEIPAGDDLADNYADPANSKLKMASGYTYCRQANSSLPVETLPGPRVDHLDRGDVDQTGPFGSYNNEEEPQPADKWTRDDGTGSDYAYTSEWDNNLLDKAAGTGSSRMVIALLKKGFTPERIIQTYAARILKLTLADVESARLMAERGKAATSAMPDSNTDRTPTEGWDFGLGYGEGNDAHGQGAGGYGNVDPDGRGVFGPSTKLPNDPGGKMRDDESDTTPTIELEVGRSSMPRTAVEWKATAVLPNDDQPPVARSDYYQGDKGSNMRNTGPSNVGSAKLPGTQMPAKDAPLSARPAHLQEHMFADSGLPGEPTVDYDYDKDVQPGSGYRYERSNQPYIKWDSETHNMRPDDLHQRDDQGPYVKQEG
jgi:hypothetical protein